MGLCWQVEKQGNLVVTSLLNESKLVTKGVIEN